MLKKTLIATAAIAATLWAAATVLPALAQPRSAVGTPSAEAAASPDRKADRKASDARDHGDDHSDRQHPGAQTDPGVGGKKSDRQAHGHNSDD
jgi:hypothetical protein